MPVMHVTEKGRPGYRWGKSGKIYFYEPGNEVSRLRAFLQAERQGKAAYAGGYSK